MKGARSRLSSNPIFIRLCGRNRWIPPAFTFILVLAAQSTVTTLLAVPYLRSPIPGHTIVQVTMAGWLVVLIMPAIIAVATALIVAQDARSEAYQLLALTNVTADSRVNGYVAGALYRMRLLVMLLALITPWLASGMLIVPPGRRAIRYLRCPPNDVRCSPFIDTGTLPGIVAVEAVVIHLMIWELLLLATCVGVIAGQKWRHSLHIASLVFAPVLLLNGAVIYGWSIEDWIQGSPGTVGILPVQVGICAGIFVLSSEIRRLARRWM